MALTRMSGASSLAAALVSAFTPPPLAAEYAEASGMESREASDEIVTTLPVSIRRAKI